MAFGLAFSSGCNRAASGLIRVDGVTFSRGDVELRAREQALENNAIVDGSVALKQLIRAQAGAAILKKYGREVTAKTLEDEATRIDRTTLIPARLQQTKALFPDHPTYIRLYVLPVFVNRVLYYDFFANERSFHQKAYDQLAAFAQDFQAARKKKEVPLFSFATERGLRVLPLKVDPKTGIAPSKGHALHNEGPNPSASQAEAKRLIAETLSKTKLGELTPIIERHKGTTYEIEAISVPKAAFEEWLSGEMRKLSIECLDNGACGPLLLERMLKGT
jgi:hypothetical protein